MSSLMRSRSFTSHTYYYDLYIYHTYKDLVEKAGVLEERLRVETPAESGRQSLAEGVDDLTHEVLVFHQAYTLFCPIHIPYVQ